MNLQTSRRAAFALAACSLLLVVWIRSLPLSLDGAGDRAQKALLSYETVDGRQYPYLGDFDSYFWLRLARNVLETGTICDAVAGEDCRDLRAHAPVGRSIPYERSLHVFAIATLHRLITVLHPDFPLPATALLIPVIIGALGALPAFAIGRKLAGNLGGMFAALVIASNPLFLIRSTGSDNDVWNVVLPLFLVWGTMCAVTGRRPIEQATYAVGAGFIAALHAATWRGWVFIYGVVVAALLLNLGVVSARGLLRGRGIGVRLRRDLARAALLAVVFYSAVGLFMHAIGTKRPYTGAVLELLGFAFPGPASTSAASASNTAHWPDTFGTVSELIEPNLRWIADSMGGALLFFIAWLGLLLLLLPRSGWRWWHFLVLIAGNYLYYYLLTSGPHDRLALLALLASPLLIAVLLHVVLDEEDAHLRAGLVVAVWFMGALFLSYDGFRFVMLLAPPFGIAFATAIGRAYEWSVDLIAGRRLALLRALSFALACLLLLPTLIAGHATARRYLPHIHDAWWETLQTIRAESPEDAIVTSWWDYGYWIEYGAQRAATADGGSLGTHLPHWIGRLLLAPTERESLGLLRMLNCASELMPLPEGEAGAYGRLLADGVDPVEAYDWLIALAQRNRAEARRFLEGRGVGEPSLSRVLAATHCEPPASYLVLSSRMAAQRAWIHLGGWDFRRAHLAQHLRLLPEDQAVARLTQRFGYGTAAARTLYRDASSLGSPSAVRDFIASPTGYLMPGWFECNEAAGEGAVTCPIDLRFGSSVVESFVYPTGSPADGRLRWRPSGEQLRTSRPASIILAGPDRKQSVRFPSPRETELGVLVDGGNGRVLVGAPRVLGSTFTHLMFLDGRYAKRYRKLSDRVGFGGERVVTWAVDWR